MIIILIGRYVGLRFVYVLYNFEVFANNKTSVLCSKVLNDWCKSNYTVRLLRTMFHLSYVYYVRIYLSMSWFNYTS